MIIDTHQHFWNLDKPWSKGPEDYKILALPEGVTGTVLRLPETQEALDLAEDEPFIVGVCGAIANDENFEKNLDLFSRNKLFKGICYIGHELEKAGPELISRMELLAGKDYQLDLLRVCPGFYGGPPSMQRLYGGTKESLEAVFRIAESVPDLRMVVEHIGGMAIDGRAITPEWMDIFQRMARHPNIFIKVSGLMERYTGRAPDEIAPTRLSIYRYVLDELWNLFGEDRLFYGSNWPVSEHAGDYIAQGLRIVRPYFAGKGSAALDKYFWKNSKVVYKWERRLPSQA